MENINISIIDMVIVLSYMVGCVILGFIKFDQIKNIRDYIANTGFDIGLNGKEHIYRHPRNYSRRGVFSIDELYPATSVYRTAMLLIVSNTKTGGLVVGTVIPFAFASAVSAVSAV